MNGSQYILKLRNRQIITTILLKELVLTAAMFHPGQEGDPFVDMRLNAGTCQNCRHLHLKVRVDGYPAAGKVLATP